MKQSLSFIALLIFCQSILAQYTVNGNAQQVSCNCYDLTQELTNQSGSVWNNNMIDLSQSFNFQFNINLGRLDGNGADGIAFVLQPLSTSVGSTGGGLGYYGIFPAVGVTIDTYLNADNGDPAFDHIAIQLNGDLNHTSANNIAGPVTAINGNDNIEDGNTHSLRIEWDAATKTLSAYIDGVLRVSAVKDFVTDVFIGDPMVFWGFTGGTGGLVNAQKFCTALNPSFHLAPGQKRCVGEPIAFYDSTISFTSLAKFYWDFGDGSPLDSIHVNPVHTYTNPGDYTVVLIVKGADGCMATHGMPLRVGTKPTAFIRLLPGFNPCAGFNNQYIDSSYLTFGTINKWHWDFGGGITSALQNPMMSYPSYGVKNIKLAVTSLEGCESDTAIRITEIKLPVVDFDFTDSVCLGQPTFLYDKSIVLPGGAIGGRVWFFDGINPLNMANPVYTFPSPGLRTVMLVAGPDNSCLRFKIKNIFVIDKPHAAFKSIAVCTSEPIVLQDSSYVTDGVGIASWWWDLGNGQFSLQRNPTVTYTASGPVTVKLVVTNSRGCISDTLAKTFFVKPSPNASMSFKDGCKNEAVTFTAVDNNGSVTDWAWSFGDGGISNTKDAQHTYNANGIYKVMLVAAAPNACYNDTLRKDIAIYSTHAFAGNDITAALGQPIQLNASGGLSYAWSPAAGLSNAAISNPAATLSASQTFTVKAYTPAGCETYDDITIKIFNFPDIYLPNAFTPNNDNLNDVFRAIPAGLKQFNFLKIYNRWGQLVFYTTDYSKGWDGYWKGKKQVNGIYVVLASGVDYRGHAIEKTATVMLIR